MWVVSGHYLINGGEVSVGFVTSLSGQLGVGGYVSVGFVRELSDQLEGGICGFYHITIWLIGRWMGMHLGFCLGIIWY